MVWVSTENSILPTLKIQEGVSKARMIRFKELSTEGWGGQRGDGGTGRKEDCLCLPEQTDGAWLTAGSFSTKYGFAQSNCRPCLHELQLTQEEETTQSRMYFNAQETFYQTATLLQ